MQLFTNQAANGTSEEFAYRGERGTGLMNVYVAGSLGGGTLTVQAKVPGGDVFVSVTTITEPGMHVIEAAPFIGRLELTDSTSPDLSVWIESDGTEARSRLYGV